MTAIQRQRRYERQMDKIMGHVADRMAARKQAYTQRLREALKDLISRENPTGWQVRDAVAAEHKVHGYDLLDKYETLVQPDWMTHQ